MALSSGVGPGPCEIQSPLGAGGMGEVFRARDTRLDRTAAIKVRQLSANGGSDPVWSPDATHAYFYSNEAGGGLASVAVDSTRSTLSRGVPRHVLSYRRPPAFPLAIAPDGKRCRGAQRPRCSRT